MEFSKRIILVKFSTSIIKLKYSLGSMAKDSTASGLNECGGRGFGRVKLFRLEVVSIVTSAPLSFCLGSKT